jgi:predicted DsbA family dithiol-disulfide isomerase
MSIYLTADYLCPVCGTATLAFESAMVCPFCYGSELIWLVIVEYAPNLGVDQIPRTYVYLEGVDYHPEHDPPLHFQYTFPTEAQAEAFAASYR